MSDCEYCAIAAGKAPAKKVFENEKVYAILSPMPASAGHIVLFPKAHYPIIENVKDPEIAHLFSIANKLSTAAFESIGAHGTNIIIQNGVAAGQKVAHFCIHIIPRREDDGLNLMWQTKQLTEEQMSTVELQMKEAANTIGEFEKEKKEPVDLDQKKEVKEIKGDNYFIRQLRRIP
jgi:histidine triad (HIT) family protein